MGKVAARDLRKQAEWRRRFRQQVKSGQSVRAWCREHGLTETAFYWWRRELARRDAEDGDASFVPVHVTEEPGRDSEQPHADQRGSDGQIEIVLPDGRRIRLTGPVDGQALVDVLDVLERRTC